MANPKVPRAFLQRLKAVTDKRPRTVIEHILEHGHITTEELREKYGYNHPPRAARDVRDQGIPLETFKVTGSDGRRMAAYRFADLSTVRRGFLGGRRTFPKAFKGMLLEASRSRCQVCSQPYEERYLQIDHRIPYEVSDDIEFDERDAGSYVLLCGSCNRAKSWSCEHCRNWVRLKSPKICSACYWSSPESYAHIAMQDTRRADLVWMGDEVAVHDKLRQRANQAREAIPEYVKRLLRQITSKNGGETDDIS
jgi:hypothetical protein